VIAWPFFAVVGLLSLPIIRVLYGTQWDVSAPVAQVLCLMGSVAVLATFAGDVMIAHGKVGQATASQLLTQPVRVGAVLAASPFGLTAIAWALVLVECYTVAVTSRRLRAVTEVAFTDVMRAAWKSFLVTLASSIAPAIMMLSFDAGRHAWLEVVLGGAGALIGWLIAILWTGHPAKDHLYQARDWAVLRIRGRPPGPLKPPQ